MGIIIRKTIILFLALTLLSSVVTAENETELPIDIEIEPVKDRIDFGEFARFKVTINNPRENIETFVIRPAGPYIEWLIKTDPPADSHVKAYPNTEREVFIDVKPLSVGLGRYALRMEVLNEVSQESFKKDVIVNVISMSNLPAVSISATVPEVINPKDLVTVKVWLENRNALKLDDIEVELKSRAIHAKTKTSLGPKDSFSDKKTLEFSIQLNDSTAPIEDSLRIFLYPRHQGEKFELRSAAYDYKIVPYGGLTDIHNRTFKFLGKHDHITFVNDANTPFEGKAKVRNPLLLALFTKADPKPTTFFEGGKRYMGWDISLKSQETFSVTVEASYVAPILIIVLIVLSIIFYYKFRSPIVLSKSTQDVVRKEGGVTHFKIVLSARNRTSKTIEKISVIDRIPNMADFVNQGEVGVLQPSKIAHTKRGVLAKWVIDALDKDEERVIKYSVRLRLGVLGRFFLPVALAKFTNEKGKVKRTYSNRMNLGSE